MAEPMKQEDKAYPLARRDGGAVSLMPTNLEDAYRVAQRLANSGLVPSSMRGSPDAVFAGMLLANEIGVSPMNGLSNISVVNGRASVWGELATAMVRSSGLCEYLAPPKFTGSGASLKVTVVGKRKGEKEEVSFEYSMDDAKLAGHTEKDTYKKNPKDMIMWKALHRLFKFLWPDVLKGLSFREFDGEVIEAEVDKGVEIAGALPEGGGAIPAPKDNPKPEPATEMTKEEIAAKVEKARAKMRGEGEPVKEEPKAEEPKPEPKPEGKPEPEAEAELVEDAGAKAPGKEDGADLPDGNVRHIGTVTKCPYRAKADKSGYEYFVVLNTTGGEIRLKCADKSQAEAFNKMKGETATVVANKAGEVVKY